MPVVLCIAGSHQDDPANGDAFQVGGRRATWRPTTNYQPQALKSTRAHRSNTPQPCPIQARKYAPRTQPTNGHLPVAGGKRAARARWSPASGGGGRMFEDASVEGFWGRCCRLSGSFPLPCQVNDVRPTTGRLLINGPGRRLKEQMKSMRSGRC